GQTSWISLSIPMLYVHSPNIRPVVSASLPHGREIHKKPLCGSPPRADSVVSASLFSGVRIPQNKNGHWVTLIPPMPGQKLLHPEDIQPPHPPVCTLSPARNRGRKLPVCRHPR